MADPRFVGLVHSLLASAQAVLGEEHSPMGRHLERDGVRSRRTADRSRALLETLLVKTQGNLDETERAALADALRWIRERTDDAGDDGAQALPMASAPRDPN